MKQRIVNIKEKYVPGMRIRLIKMNDICEAFGFEIPAGYAPEYVVRKTNKGKRGRPRKNKLVVKEES